MGTAVRRYLPSVIALVLAAGLLPLGSPPAARAAGSVSLVAADVAFTEDFDTLATTGTTNTALPNGWDLIEGGGGSRDNEQYAAGDGNSGTGDTYSFGTGTNTERAFGGLQSGTLIPTIGASFTNDTGETITALAISYVCEMWRAGALNRGAADRLDFQLSTDATGLTTGTWTDADSLDCNSPNTMAATNMLDGNAVANQANMADTLTGLSIAAGSGFWLRWTDFNISGSDDGLAIDSFSLTPNPSGPTDPSGVGNANPAVVTAGDSSLLTVIVTPGTNPASTELAVEADLTAIGGSASQALFDDGTNGGDATAGDNIFSFLATVAGGTAAGTKNLPAMITDAEARSGSATIELGVIAAAAVVISKVYGGGGNSGATYTNDFIELFNRGADPVSLAGWSVQYASAAGTTWQVTLLSGTMLPGRRYLIQQAAGAGGATALPAPDATGSIAMAAGSAKVALVASTVALTGSCPSPAAVVDLVGYGTANCFEGTGAAPTLSNTTAAIRIDNGCTDTNDNDNDFFTGTAAPGSAGEPFNSSAPQMPCLPTGPNGVGSADPSFVLAGDDSLLTVDVSAGTIPTSTGLAVEADLTDIGGSASQTFFDDGSNGDMAAGDNTFSYLATVAPATSPGAKSLPFTVTDAQSRSGSGSISLNVVAPCGDPYTPTFTLQGSGATTTMAGAHDTQGVVIGNYQGTTNTTLRGFYIQDAAGDGLDTTSDGLFVFNGGPNQTLAVGDLVRVSGTVTEFQGQTQVSMSSVIVCGTGHDVTPADVTFPVPPPVGGVDYLERVEGMLVELPQTLYVTEHFQLGRFGQVTMSSGDRLQQPTAVVDPGAPANAMQAANNLNRIIVDDDSQAQNPDPILFGRGGNPLSASNTLRGGDTAIDITGVMSWTWAGNHGSASVNAWRVRPVSAMHGGVPDFQPANPRPETRPDVGGTVQVGALNLLNYFNTFTGCITGVGDTTPSTSDCRGAGNSTEFDRQWPKTVAAIVGMDVDVLGIMEIENDGYGPASAIAHLVDRLNDATAPGTYAFIDADAGTSEIDSLGTDAIKVGLIYRPADVIPVGATAALNSIAFVNSGTPEPRNRPSLAQAFEINGNGGVFVVDVNHLKSKGSGCGPASSPDDAGDGQGNCNDARTVAAELLADWLATDPTGTGTSDVLIVGDLNSYAMEDPIVALESAGYTNLVRQLVGVDAYSFVFDGQWGYLDHALGSPSVTARVTGVTEWHINADEPSVLDYNTNFKSPGQIASLHAFDEYRMSDHDPVIVGLDYGPAGTKAAVIAALESLLPTGSAGADKRIAAAISSLQTSLTPIWWIDSHTLHPTHGAEVFEAEHKAILELTKKELAGNATVASLVELILDADRALAQTALDAAIAGGGQPQQIERAQAEMARGDADRAAGRYGQAVIRYKAAWEHAINALD
jgi:predicted extracellular nuclease